MLNVARGADQKSATPYWAKSLTGFMLGLIARLISPNRARPWCCRPSATIDKNRRAAEGQLPWSKRHAARVSCSTAMRDCSPSHFADNSARVSPMLPESVVRSSPRLSRLCLSLTSEGRALGFDLLLDPTASKIAVRPASLGSGTFLGPDPSGAGIR